MTGFKSKRAAAGDKLGTVKERLIRMMGTFDLATGHADTWDELLDALESELRDVLGHYRAALAQPAQEPVVWMGYERGLKMFTAQQRIADAYPEIYTVPLYPLLPQRPWVDLTFDEKQHALYISDWKTTYMEAVIEYLEAKLKEKNA